MRKKQSQAQFDRQDQNARSFANESGHNVQALRYTGSFGKFEEQPPLQQQLLELAAFSEMQTEALEKASQMITLLEEQQQELQSEIKRLSQQLFNKKVKIEYLENIISDITTSNKQSGIQSPLKNSLSSSKIEALTGSKLLFSFSQPQRPNPESATTTPATYEPEGDLLISQELQPWQGPQGVIAGLKQVISRESNSQVALRQIDQLISNQQIESEMLKWQVEEKLEQIQGIIDYDISFSSREEIKSSSTETERQAEQTQWNILRQYERIIISYKDYTARLRAHLCEIINSVAQLGSSFASALPHEQWNIANLSSFVTKVLLAYRGKGLQNRQLHAIIQGLIENLKALRDNFAVGRRSKFDDYFQ